MFGVYEVCTLDDVSYNKLSSFDNELDALKECDRLKKERAKVFVPSQSLPSDPICYTVMSDLKFHLLMNN